MGCGTRLVMSVVVREAFKRASQTLFEETRGKSVMRSVTTKMLVSLVGVALAAPFFAIAVIVGARVVALAGNTQDDLLLVGLAFGGAGLSMINGFASRRGEAERIASGRADGREDADSHGDSVFNLGY